MITKSLWDTVSGKDVFLFHIENKTGAYVDVIEYGASIHRLVVPDRNGCLGDTVLGAKDGKQILEDFTGEGITVGRCANRIRGGQCVLGEKTIQLSPLDKSGNCLHSGSDHYGHQFFRGEADEETNTVHFYYEDEGNSGFHTLVHAHIAYRFDDYNQLHIMYDLDPEEETVLSPTNHAYFNLDQKDVSKLELWLKASHYAPKTEHGLPEGGIEPVAGTEFDFTSPISIGEGLSKIHRERVFYDDHFILDGQGFRPVARLHSKESGRTLTISTDMPSIVMYVGAERAPMEGKDGLVYQGRCFICLETQFVTNAVNCPQYASPVFKAHERYISETIYGFSVE